MEERDVYDIHKVKTGKVKPRKEPYKKGEYYLFVKLVLLNSSGEVFLQQRQKDARIWPNKWDFAAGGGALAGETSQQAIERESFEEIGFQKDFTYIRPFFTAHFAKGFTDYYIVKEDFKAEEAILQKKEVQKVKWATKEEAFALLAEGTFIPYHQGLLSMVFSMGENQKFPTPSELKEERK